MELHEIFPHSELAKRLGIQVHVEEYTHRDLNALARVKGSGMLAMGLNLWNRIVQRKLVKGLKPQAIAPWVKRQDPFLFRGVESAIRRSAFLELYYLRATISPPINGEEEVAEFFVGRVFPNEVILEDISIIDPRHPLAPDEQKSEFHIYRGLGLLPTVMANLETYAIERKCKFIALTAGRTSNVPMFQRYGFQVENNRFARDCLKEGVNIPMEKSLSVPSVTKADAG